MDYRVRAPSSPDDDPTPPTEPQGALVPPPRAPPPAVRAAAAGPAPRPARPLRSWSPPARRRRRPWLCRTVKTALDVLHGVADGLLNVGKVLTGATRPRRRP